MNESKLARQEEALHKWRNAGGIGTLDLVMRFGKTRIGLMAIDKMACKNSKLDAIVVVPSVTVKQEWESQIKEYNDTITLISPYIRIFTASQLIDDDIDIKADLLIIDEVHKFTSDKRLKILRGEIVKYKHLMCLTGSMPGGDMRNKIVAYAPVVDKLAEEEAIAKGWISNFIEFNIPLEFPENDKLEYREYSNIITEVLNKFKGMHKLFRYKDGTLMFDSDFDLIMACYSGKTTPYGYVAAEYVRVGIVTKESWNPDLAKDWTDEIIKNAAYKFNKAIAKRNELLINNIVKLEAVLNIYKSNPVPTICFNESTAFADIITDAINNNISRTAICYHSNVETTPLIDPITGDWIRYNERSVNAGKIKKFGKDSLRKLAIEGMRDGRYTFLSTAKAFDEGLTISNLQQVITTAGTANPMQYAQRSARGKTVDIYNPNKVTKIYNLYFDDFYIGFGDERQKVVSRDKTKLFIRQGTNRTNIVTISINELLE